MEIPEHLSTKEAQLVVRRFLSSLSWVEGWGIRETGSIVGSQRIGLGRAAPPLVLTNKKSLDYLPEPKDPKALLALALYREALSVNSVAYQCLGLFKVLNVQHSDGRAQMAWIRRMIQSVEDTQALARLRELEESHDDVARYLYESGRCAVAHAFSEPLVDPDRSEDLDRLHADLPVVRSLAELLIERELGIQSQQTVWGKHLYELDGFKEVLGNDIVRALASSAFFETSEIPRLPPVSIRVRGEPHFQTLELLDSEWVSLASGTLVTRCQNKQARLKMLIALDFTNERLRFSPFDAIEIDDDGSPGPVAAAIDRANLVAALLNNGTLEVWRTHPEALLGRWDPYLPVNIDVRKSLAEIDQTIQGLELLKLQREQDREDG